ncbi:MAG: PD40 domain-containing protein [Kiritimatiellae bacterium]|nr:PD40 domain-containing protein [Kiritimatiellia bacterium]
MKSFAVIVSLLCIFCLHAHAVEQSSFNGSFEAMQGTLPANWRIEQGPPSSLTVNAKIAAHGNQSLQLSSWTEAERVVARTIEPLRLEPNARYRFSMRWRILESGLEIGQSFQAWVRFTGRDGRRLKVDPKLARLFSGGMTKPMSHFRSGETTFTVPEHAEQAHIEIRLQKSHPERIFTGTILFDDIQIQRLSEPADYALPKESLAFDFVIEEGEAARGFAPVPFDRDFAQSKDYGWTTPPKRSKVYEYNYPNYPTRLYGQGAERATFACRIAPGRYAVSLFTGRYWRNDILETNHRVSVNGEPVVNENRSLDELMDTEYFRHVQATLVTHDDLERKGLAVFDKYLRWQYRRHDFEIDAVNETLTVQALNGRICGLVITPVALKREHQAAMQELDRALAQEFAVNFAELVPNREDAGSYTPSRADRDRGYLVFRRYWMRGVEHNSRPEPYEVDTTLETYATPGEYEPVTFSIWPLRDLNDVRIEAENLRTRQGHTIDARAIRIWYLQQRHNRVTDKRGTYKYQIRGVFLPDWGPSRDLYKDITQRGWLSLKIPEDAAPGLYQGNIWIKPSGQAATALRLQVRVLPFSLVRPERLHAHRPGGLWIILPYGWAPEPHVSGRAPTEADPRSNQFYQLQALRDLKNHGYGPFFQPWWPNIVDYEAGKIDWHAVGWATGSMDGYLQRIRAVWPQARSLLIGSGANKRLYDRPSPDAPLPEWTSVDDNWLKAIDKKLAEYGFTKGILIYGAEESHGIGQQNADVWGRRMDHIRQGREAGLWPRIHVATTCNTHWGTAVAITHADFPGLGMFHGVSKDAREFAEMAQATGKPFLLYGDKGRITPGFYLVKAGAYGTFREHYANCRGRQNDEWGQKIGQGVPHWTGALYSRAGRMVGSYLSEELREGVDDDAYVHTLKQYLEKSEADQRPAVRRARRLARAALSGILNFIDLDEISGRPFPPEDFDGLRWKAALATSLLCTALKGEPVGLSSGGSSESSLLAEVSVEKENQAQGDSRVVHELETVRVRPLAQPIVLDGKLDEPCWRRAPARNVFFQLGTLKPGEPATKAWVYSRNDVLYLGVRCEEPKPAGLKTRAQEYNVGNIWDDDVVEMFLDSNHDHDSYYHFAITPGSTRAGYCHRTRHRKNSGLNALAVRPEEWRGKAFVGKDFWSAELALPITALKIAPSFGLSVARSAPAHSLCVAWSLPRDWRWLHEPERFLDVYLPEVGAELEKWTPGHMVCGENRASFWLKGTPAGRQLRVKFVPPDGTPRWLAANLNESNNNTHRFDAGYALGKELGACYFNVYDGETSLGNYKIEYQADNFSAYLDRYFVRSGSSSRVPLHGQLAFPPGADLRGLRFEIDVLQNNRPVPGKRGTISQLSGRRFTAMLSLGDLALGVYDIRTRLFSPQDDVLKATYSEFEVLPGGLDAKARLDGIPSVQSPTSGQAFSTVIHSRAQGGIVTDNRHKDSSPSVSADGKALAFVSEQEYPDVWLLELETKRLARLTRSAQTERFPVIAPDGKSVAYLTTQGTTSHLYWLPVSNGTPIDFGAGDDILFSPDGKWLVSRDDQGLFIVNLETRKRRALASVGPGEAGTLRWRKAAEQDWIYYLAAGDLWRIGVRGGRAAGEPEKLFESTVDGNAQVNFNAFDLAPGTPADRETILAILDYSSLAVTSKDKGVLLTRRAGAPPAIKELGEMTEAMWIDETSFVFASDGTLYRQELGGKNEPLAGAGQDNAAGQIALPRDRSWVYFAARRSDRRGGEGKIRAKYTEICRAPLK